MVYNPITHLPYGVFSHLNWCTELDLYQNKIATIDVGAFSGLRALQKLNLFSNQISMIEDGAFDRLLSLKYLYLEHNNLTTLNSGALKFVRRPLALALGDPHSDTDRPWTCDSLCWLKKEEKAGSISWMESIGRKKWPECSSGTSWSNKACKTNKSLTAYSQAYMLTCVPPNRDTN